MTLPKDLREFIELFHSRNIEYLVVGAFAVAYHGFPRSTGDIDLFVRVSQENARKLAAVFAEFGFASLGLREADFLRRDQTIQLGRPPNRIDVLTGITGVSFEQAWASRQAGEIDGVPVWFISKELLVQNKTESGRPKDLLDAAELQGR